MYVCVFFKFLFVAAAKVAGNELHGLISYFGTNVDGLSFPLMCLLGMLFGFFFASFLLFFCRLQGFSFGLFFVAPHQQKHVGVRKSKCWQKLCEFRFQSL